jgi:hypothetical protein
MHKSGAVNYTAFAAFASQLQTALFMTRKVNLTAKTISF